MGGSYGWIECRSGAKVQVIGYRSHITLGTLDMAVPELTPSEARAVAVELLKAADSIDPGDPLPGAAAMRAWPDAGPAEKP